MEALEQVPLLHTQEVRGSSPCAPTNPFSNLRVKLLANVADVRKIVRKRVGDDLY